MTTEALLRQVWGRRGSGDTDRVRTAMKKLRKKLGDDAANPAYIFNAHGVAYRFASPGTGGLSHGPIAAAAGRPPLTEAIPPSAYSGAEVREEE